MWRENPPVCLPHSVITCSEHTGEGTFQRCDTEPGLCCHGSEKLEFQLLCTPLNTSGNGDRFFSFVQKLPWKWPYLFPSALEDSIVRPHYNQITQEGDFSFPFLKLDPYLCANRREIQTLAERGPLSGVPDCRGSNPSAASTVQGQARELGRSGILYGLCKCL